MSTFNFKSNGNTEAEIIEIVKQYSNPIIGGGGSPRIPGWSPANGKPGLIWDELDEIQVKNKETGEYEMSTEFGKWRDRYTGLSVNCGRAGLVVFDLDVKNDENGVESFQQFCEDHSYDPSNTLIVRTPSGGLHYYFKSDETFRNSVNLDAMPGVDIRANGGATVFAGSWKWMDDAKTEKGYYEIANVGDIQPLPDVLREVLIAVDIEAEKARQERIEQARRDFDSMPNLWGQGEMTPFAEQILQEYTDKMANAQKGERHYTQLEAARKCAQFGVPHDMIWERIGNAARVAGRPEDSIEQDMEDGIAYGDNLHVEYMMNRPPLEYTNRQTDFATHAPAHRQQNTTERAPSQSGEGVAQGVDAEHQAELVPEGTAHSADSGDSKKQKKGEVSELASEETLSDLFIESLRGKALYVDEWKSWSLYVEEAGLWSTPYQSDTKTRREVRGTIQKTADNVFTRCKTFLSNYRKELQEQYDDVPQLVSRRKIADIVEIARHALLISSADFDRRDDLFACGNGVLDLKTRKLHPFDPEYLMTMGTTVNFNPHLDEEYKREFSDLMNKILTKDELVYVQSLLGQSMFGYQPSEGIVNFFIGGGGNGKSTLRTIVSRVMGDYCGLPSSSVLLSSRTGAGASDGGHEFMVFKGLRLAFFEELPDNRHLDSEAIKRLADTPTMRAAEKFQKAEHFEFKATVIINTNHLPAVDDLGAGMWRRLKPLPFNSKFTNNQAPNAEKRIYPRNPKYASTRLESNTHTPSSSGFLEAAMLWMTQGALDWYQNDEQLQPEPQSVSNTAASWLRTNDKIGDFIAEMLTINVSEDSDERLSDDQYVLWDDVYEAYAYHTKQAGLNPTSKRRFKNEFEEHTFAVKNDLQIRRLRTSNILHNEWENPSQKGYPSYEPREPKEREYVITGVDFL